MCFGTCRCNHSALCVTTHVAETRNSQHRKLTLQHVCTGLQYTATHCNTLPHARAKMQEMVLQGTRGQLFKGIQRAVAARSCVAVVCCSGVLQLCVAVVCCSVLQLFKGNQHALVAECYGMCFSVLQCVAVCCRVLQCVAVCCSVLQCVAILEMHADAVVAVCCTVLLCAAVCCSSLRACIMQC